MGCSVINPCPRQRSGTQGQLDSRTQMWTQTRSPESPDSGATPHLCSRPQTHVVVLSEGAPTPTPVSPTFTLPTDGSRLFLKLGAAGTKACKHPSLDSLFLTRIHPLFALFVSSPYLPTWVLHSQPPLKPKQHWEGPAFLLVLMVDGFLTKTATDWVLPSNTSPVFTGPGRVSSGR